MMLAHIGGVPVEELLPMAPVVGAAWLALSASVHERRQRRSGAAAERTRP
jgi:hypothetical protein